MSQKARTRLVVVLLLSLLSPVGLAAQAPARAVDPGLQPGDIVRITVWQNEDLSGEFTVARDGTIVHPLYRQIRVQGVAPGEIEPLVRDFLRGFEADPQVVAHPLYHVSVSGQVMSPDVYNLEPGTTVADAVTLAGGVAETGKRDEVQLIRTGQITEFDLESPMTGAASWPVRSGDQILVPSEEEGQGILTRVIIPLVQVAATVASLVTIATN